MVHHDACPRSLTSPAGERASLPVVLSKALQKLLDARRDFSVGRSNISGMKVARDARSAAVVINAGSRRGAAVHGLAVDRMQKAGVPISSVHQVVSGAELAETLDRVIDDGHDLIVVGGGDGR